MSLMLWSSQLLSSMMTSVYASSLYSVIIIVMIMRIIIVSDVEGERVKDRREYALKRMIIIIMMSVIMKYATVVHMMKSWTEKGKSQDNKEIRQRSHLQIRLRL